MRMSMYFMILLSVLVFYFHFFCKHVRLSCVFLNKLTYLNLLTYYENNGHLAVNQYKQFVNFFSITCYVLSILVAVVAAAAAVARVRATKRWRWTRLSQSWELSDGGKFAISQ